MQYKMTVRDSEDYEYVYGTITFKGVQSLTKEDWKTINQSIAFTKEYVEDYTIVDIMNGIASKGYDIEYDELPELAIRL